MFFFVFFVVFVVVVCVCVGGGCNFYWGMVGWNEGVVGWNSISFGGYMYMLGRKGVGMVVVCDNYI